MTTMEFVTKWIGPADTYAGKELRADMLTDLEAVVLTSRRVTKADALTEALELAREHVVTPSYRQALQNRVLDLEAGCA